MIRTSFVTRSEIAKLISTAQSNKTKTATKTFTEKQVIYIWKYLKRNPKVWARISKKEYVNANRTLKLTFVSNTQIKVEVR